jgi:hypothetical protein
MIVEDLRSRMSAKLSTRMFVEIAMKHRLTPMVTPSQQTGDTREVLKMTDMEHPLHLL